MILKFIGIINDEDKNPFTRLKTNVNTIEAKQNKKNDKTILRQQKNLVIFLNFCYQFNSIKSAMRKQTKTHLWS